MLTLMIEGGVPMWFLLLFGVATLGSAAQFAWRGDPRGLQRTVWLGAATGLSALTGICSAFGAVGHHAPRYLAAHPGTSMVEVLLQGFAESMSAGILGGAMLSISALLVAVGVQRRVA